MRIIVDIYYNIIEGYPYWTPLTYIGQDSIGSEITDYHFYHADFEPIITISANSYESVDSNKERMFVIRTFDGENEHKQLLNAENGSIRDVDYDYIHFHLSLTYGYGESRWRTILQKSDGKIILDSIQHKCYAMGNFIQIIHNEDSEFLNTITGEIGLLGITAPVDKNGKIDFKKIGNINNVLSIENDTSLRLLSTEEEKTSKVKKLLPNQKIKN